MRNRTERTISRREFAQRAALLSATASFAPAEMLRADISSDSAPRPQQTAPKLNTAGQAEADARYQQILALYSDRLDDSQKATVKRMCNELQPALERLRVFKLENSDVPALFLKPLYERDRQSSSSHSKPGTRPANQP
jgi:hypothetical protein